VLGVAWNERQELIRSVVRDTRFLIRDIDPARLQSSRSDVRALDDYDAPALEVARALVDGASPDEAVAVLRDQMLQRFGLSLSGRARRLCKYFKWRIEG
jgi:hypothetical protein